jgi:putative peptidoglycan lipid II flippase
MTLALPFTIVGSATLLSRMTGFVRDVLIAAMLGTGGVADAYVAAFLIPNLIRKMMSEGALNAAVVPRLARLEQQGGAEAARAFSDDVFSLLSVVLVVLVAVAELAMPALMSVLAHGFRADEAKFAEAVLFGRIAFPFVGFIVVVALMASVLNAVERFGAAALIPLVLNLMMIAVLVGLMMMPADKRQAGLVLVSTVLLAGMVQLALLWRSVAKAGFAPRPRFLDALRGRIDPEAKTLLLLSVPGMIAAGSGHVHMIVASQFASLHPAAVSWLYYTDRLFQLPLGFVAAAVGIVLLPRMSRALQMGDDQAIAEAQSEGFSYAFLLILPAAMGLAVLAEPITQVLYQRGAFTGEDARATAHLLRILSSALPAFVLIKVILPGFLAREEFRIPLLAVGVALAVNIATAFLLWSGQGGASPAIVAPAYGVAAGAWVNALVLLAGGKGRIHLLPHTLVKLLACLVAACAMGVAVHYLGIGLAESLSPQKPFYIKGPVLIGLCGAGVAIYLATARFLGAFRFSRLRLKG